MYAINVSQSYCNALIGVNLAYTLYIIITVLRMGIINVSLVGRTRYSKQCGLLTTSATPVVYGIVFEHGF